MDKIRRLSALAVFLVISTISIFGQSVAQKVTLENSNLLNLYKIDQGVYRSEQPTAADFVALEQFGVVEVLSLRNWHNDLGKSKGTSLTLHTLPTRASKIDQQDILKALRIIRNRKGAILVHCWHGSDRTGAVCAMYRIVFQNWSKQSAVDEMVYGGFGFHVQYKQIIDVINSADVEYLRRELGIQ